jgi:hypothetical protein
VKSKPKFGTMTAMATARTRVFLHVGTRKSGTTYLQRALRNSRVELAEAGIRVAATTQDDADLAVGLRRFRDTGDEAAGEQAIDQLLEALDSSEPRQIVTLEALAELPERIADAVVGALQENHYDVDIVVTARHWGRSIPSEWQQSVKQRSTEPYRSYVEAIRHRHAAAQLFLSRHDVPAIARRWGRRLSPDRVHVIACPTARREADTLSELFCSTIGFDHARLDLPRTHLNPSMSLPQAEMVRRLNLALGERMPARDGIYAQGVRRWLTGSLPKPAHAKVLLPDGMTAWCTQESERQLEELTDLGIDLVGRPEDLVVAPSISTGPVEAVPDNVAEVAIETLADLLDKRWQEITATGV